MRCRLFGGTDDRMINYRSTEEKIEFSSKVQHLYDDLMKRIYGRFAREDTLCSPIEYDGKTPFLDVFEETKSEPYPIRLAKAIVRSWLVTEPLIFDGDILVGVVRPKRPCSEHFSYGIRENNVLGEGGTYLYRKEEIERRREASYSDMNPLDLYHMLDEADRRFAIGDDTTVHEETLNNKLWLIGGYQGHTIPSYSKLLTLGIGGVHAQCKARLAEVEEGESKNFLTACVIILEGLRDYILGYAEAADAQGRDDIAECCRAIAFDTPKTLRQACQLMWFYCLWDWCDCIGRTDRYLLPFYEKAAAENRSEAEDVIAAFMLKIYENGIHNMTLGGVDPETAEDSTNELSFLLLQVLRCIHDTHPRVSLRIHKNSDPALLELAVRMWSEGMSDPTVTSDEIVIDSFVKNYSCKLEDARDYSMLGCQEIEIPGKSNFGCEDGIFNLAKVLEFTLNDGISRFDEKRRRVGLATGKLTDYNSFEELYGAFLKQMAFFTKHFCDLCNLGQEVRAANYSKLVKSPMTESCIEKGLSLDAGGAVYNYGCVETAGSAVTSDSLYAIKKLVFDEKKLSSETLEAAIAADFKGYEAVKAMLLAVPKFGNDDEGADEMARRVLEDFWIEIKKYKSVRGDVYTGACSLLTGGISFGRRTWASADGRNTGEPLGNSIGPRPGADKNGLTAMLNSVSKLPLHLGLGGTTCNVIITKEMMKTPEMRSNIVMLMRAYLMNGGQMAQITTADVEELRDAQINPEKHQNLIIRVGGFSVKFCDLETVAQNEIISRYAS